MTAEDYEATYVNLCIFGSALIGLMVFAAFWAREFGLILESFWFVLIPGLFVMSNAIRLTPEQVHRIGKKRLVGFSLVAGQIMCVFPALLITQMFESTITQSRLLDNSVMGVLVALSCPFSIWLKDKLKERFGDI